MKKYFNFKLGSPKVNGGVIEVDTRRDLENKLRDFKDSSYEFKVKRRVKTGTSYEITIPKRQFQVGARIPSLCLDSGPGYVKTGEDKANIFLTNEGILKARKTRQGKKIFLTEITLKEAGKLKDAAFNWLMYQCYLAGY